MADELLEKETIVLEDIERIVAELRPEEHARQQAEKAEAEAEAEAQAVEAEVKPAVKEEPPIVEEEPEVRATKGHGGQEEPGVST